MSPAVAGACSSAWLSTLAAHSCSEAAALTHGALHVADQRAAGKLRGRLGHENNTSENFYIAPCHCASNA